MRFYREIVEIVYTRENKYKLSKREEHRGGEDKTATKIQKEKNRSELKGFFSHKNDWVCKILR